MQRLVIEGIVLEADYKGGLPLYEAQELVVALNDFLAGYGLDFDHVVLVASNETCKVSVEEVKEG